MLWIEWVIEDQDLKAVRTVITFYSRAIIWWLTPENPETLTPQHPWAVKSPLMMHLSFRFQPCFLLDERGSPPQKFATDVVDASTCFLSWISFAFWHVTLLRCFPRDVRYLLSFKLTKKHLWHISHCHLGQLSLSLHCARIIPILSRKKKVVVSKSGVYRLEGVISNW